MLISREETTPGIDTDHAGQLVVDEVESNLSPNLSQYENVNKVDDGIYVLLS